MGLVVHFKSLSLILIEGIIIVAPLNLCAFKFSLLAIGDFSIVDLVLIDGDIILVFFLLFVYRKSEGQQLLI